MFTATNNPCTWKIGSACSNTSVVEKRQAEASEKVSRPGAPEGDDSGQDGGKRRYGSGECPGSDQLRQNYAPASEGLREEMGDSALVDLTAKRPHAKDQRDNGQHHGDE